MDLDATLEYDRHELIVDIVEHFTVYLQRFKQILVRVLERETGQIRRDLAPAGGCAPSVRRPEEDDELRPFTDFLRSTNGLCSILVVNDIPKGIVERVRL